MLLQNNPKQTRTDTHIHPLHLPTLRTTWASHAWTYVVSERSTRRRCRPIGVRIPWCAGYFLRGLCMLSPCLGALASHHSPKTACGRGHLAASHPHWRINASEMEAFSHLSLATRITTAATVGSGCNCRWRGWGYCAARRCNNARLHLFYYEQLTDEWL